MSMSIDYFFDSDMNLRELTDEINKVLGSQLVISGPHGREQAWCIFFGMSLDLYIHSLKNEGLIDVEKYTFEIGLVGPGDVSYFSVSLIAMIAYLLYLRLQIGEGLVAYDVQVPLAIYETRRFDDGYDDLYDKISEKRVDFPQHLFDLESRLQNRCL